MYFRLFLLFIPLVTPAGKVVVALTAVISVAVFAVPAGILGWGFESVLYL